MAGEITFSGLASGLDSKSIIDQLVSVKQNQLLNPILRQSSLTKSKQTLLSGIRTNLESLRDASKVLKNVDNSAYTSRKGTSSDTDTITVDSVTSSAIKGSYVISEVSALAQGDRVIFEGIADEDANTLGQGTLSITYQGEVHTIDIDTTNNSLSEVVSAINSEDIGVTASIVNDGTGTPYRLVLTAEDTGEEATITSNLDTILGLVVDPVSAEAINEASNAHYKLNGVDMESEANSVSDAIVGVTFDILQVNEDDNITITIKQDTAAISSKISSFVSAYNSSRSLLKSVLTRSAETGQGGPLAGDIGIQTIAQNLNSAVTRRFNSLTGHEFSALADIGITADSKGNLVIDSADLSSALEEDPDGVRLLFQGSTNEDGIAEKLFTVTDGLTTSDGVFEKRNTNFESSLKRFDKLVLDRTEIVANFRLKLQRQFANLEQITSQLKLRESQLSAFSSQNFNFIGSSR